MKPLGIGILCQGSIGIWRKKLLENLGFWNALLEAACLCLLFLSFLVQNSHFLSYESSASLTTTYSATTLPIGLISDLIWFLIQPFQDLLGASHLSFGQPI